MPDQFQIILPQTTSKEDLNELQNELKNAEGVENAGTVTTRSIDPGTIAIWFEVASAIFGAVSVALPLIQKIMSMVHEKKIPAATLKLPNGMEISLENTTLEEIEQVLQKASKR